MTLHSYAPLVRYLSAWCAEHLGNPESPAYQAYHAAFARILAVKREEQSRPHDNGGLFGMSSAVGCVRAQALRREGVAGMPAKGDTVATFEIGHLLEVFALAVLEAAGFTVQQGDDGAQQTVTLGGVFQSAVDGVLTAGPVSLPYPLLLSCKTASYKSSSPPRFKQPPAKRYGFAQLPLDGIRAAQPSWYGQAQLEMAATGHTHSLVLVVAKDMIAAFEGDAIFEASGSLTWYAEVLEADATFAREITMAYRAVASHTERPPTAAPAVVLKLSDGMAHCVPLPSPGDVASGWGGPNKEATGTFNPCRGCRYGGMPEVCK